MTTHPTFWKTIVADENTAGGVQSAPKSVELANGNILVLWQDDTTGPSPGMDIIGNIFSPEGDLLSGPLQINSAVVANDEIRPKIVALPDGGFVMVYGGWFEATGDFIGVQRYDKDGNSLFSNFITGLEGNYHDWTLTADAGGNYTVAVEDSDNLRFFTYDAATNARGAEVTTDEGLGEVATFANGDILSLNSGWDVSISGNFASTTELTIIDPQTGETRRSAHISGSATFFDSTPSAPGGVAVLDSGKFVITYATGDTLNMRIGASELGQLGKEIRIADRDTYDANVVELNDGGLFVSWTHPQQEGDLTYYSVWGARFTANGVKIGETQRYGNALNADIDLSMTMDGRILMTGTADEGHVQTIILDPRERVITGTDHGEVMTTRLEGTTVFGLGGNDTLLGQAGDDTLDGGTGLDRLEGGQGSDVYVLKDVTLTGNVLAKIFDPGIVFQPRTYDTVIEDADAGIDTVLIQGVARNLSGYTLTDNVENGEIGGAFAFNLSGNAGDNGLTGNGAANTLKGNAGADRLDAGAGADVLLGGGGTDILSGRSGTDTLQGDKGADMFTFFDLQDSLTGSGRDIINDFHRNQGDRIDLHAIDAVLSGGDDAFTFIGTRAFSGTGNNGTPGELRFAQSGGDVIVSGDVDGDRVADFSMRLLDAANVVSADFLL